MHHDIMLLTSCLPILLCHIFCIFLVKSISASLWPVTSLHHPVRYAHLPFLTLHHEPHPRIPCFPWTHAPCLQVRSGETVENHELLRFATLFNDELTLDNLERVQLVGGGRWEVVCVDVGLWKGVSDVGVRGQMHGWRGW